MAINDHPYVNRILKLIFYGNYFYGVCIVCLMLETVVQFSIPYNGILFYLIAFSATVLFYNYPYARNYSSKNNDDRTQWYHDHQSLLFKTQIILTIILLVLLLLTVVKYFPQINRMSMLQWFLFLIFPLTGALYYGANVLTANYNLRRAGFIKPFVIGFVWAGVASVYPLLFNDIINGITNELTLLQVLLFLKNFMFISMLAVMFDIKDHAGDADAGLRTFVIKWGLSKTIFFLLLPLTFLGIITFFSYAFTHHFSIPKMILTLIPFLLLIIASVSLMKKRSLLYYVIVIDGLMIAKAFFDIWALWV